MGVRIDRRDGRHLRRNEQRKERTLRCRSHRREIRRRRQRDLATSLRRARGVRDATAAVVTAVSRCFRITAADELRGAVHDLASEQQLHVRAKPGKKHQPSDTPEQSAMTECAHEIDCRAR